MYGEGRASPMEFKFQWLYCSPDMSNLRLDMSIKHLWNPVNGPDKSGGPDLLWIGLTGLTGVQYRSNR
jgi:hypothetical protein